MEEKLSTVNHTGDKRIFALGSYYKGFMLMKAEDGKVGILVGGANGMGILGNFDNEAQARAVIDNPQRIAPTV